MAARRTKKNDSQENLAARAKALGFEDMIEDAEGDTVLEQAETSGNLPAVYDNSPTFDPDDVYIPRLRLAHGQSREVTEGVAKPGQWLLMGHDAEDTVSVVPIAFAKQRELRDKDSREVQCFSMDAKTGRGTPGGECVGCPFASWTPRGDDSKKNSPPACAFIYTYVVYVSEYDSLATVRFSKTGEKQGKVLNTIVAKKGMGNVVVKLSSQLIEGRYVYYVPIVTGLPDDTEILEAAASYANTI